MPFEVINIGVRTVTAHKAVRAAKFEVRNVLTNDPFDYVDLWLRRNGQSDALFYWRQAKEFFRAARDLRFEAAPLVLYYGFLNAAKALLSSKAVQFREHHGVRGHQMRGQNSRVKLSNEGLEILANNGVADSLTHYFNEQEPNRIHSLENVLYNIVCIHRTYILSYPTRREAFIPLRWVGFMRDSVTGMAHLVAKPVSDYDWKKARRYIPASFTQVAIDDYPAVHTTVGLSIGNANSVTQAELVAMQTLHEQARERLVYINGAQPLWYLKMDGNSRIWRHSITLMFIAMHRLSEICRYKPSELTSFLNGQKNWLLSEFITMSPSQYLDEIACEMTGNQILIPNVRNPV